SSSCVRWPGASRAAVMDVGSGLAARGASPVSDALETTLPVRRGARTGHESVPLDLPRGCKSRGPDFLIPTVGSPPGLETGVPWYPTPALDSRRGLEAAGEGWA